MAKEKELEFQDYLAEINNGIVPKNPADALKGGIKTVIVEEHDGTGKYEKDNFDESSIIRTDRDWKVTLVWELDGTLLTSPHFNFTGTWHMQAFLEAFGVDNPNTGNGKRDYDLKEVTKAVRLTEKGTNKEAKAPWVYEVSSYVNAGDIEPGLYRLAVALTYTDENNEPGPMAGFIEVPGMIQIYKPSK